MSGDISQLYQTLTNSLEFLFSVHPKYVLLSVAWLMLMNSSVQVPPSEGISISAGIYVAQGKVTWMSVVLIATIFNLLGTSIWYVLGRYHKSKDRTIATSPNEKVGFIRGIYTSKLKPIEILYIKHGYALIFLLRNVPLIRSICSYPAGQIKMKVGPFLVYSYLGIFLWVSIWVTLGLLLGNLAKIYKWPATVAAGVLFIVILKIAFKKLGTAIEQ